ncbi:hypothetical protein K1719_003629 [Acacia pycnantha]|nr:hypothetical protein K1719_003629 [Acacia pycnantha]
MNQQLIIYTEADKIQDYNEDGSTWFTSLLDVKKKNHILGSAMSEKEMKIRSELEMEVERDLEEELKDGICNLSLRLHRLYQRQKERESEVDKTTKALSEVNISIKMEGKTRVEIKETRKEETDDDQKCHRRHHHQRRRSWSHRSEDMKQLLVCGINNGKKVDWEKSLRAAGSARRSVSVKKTNNGSSNREYDNKGIINANIEGRRRCPSGQVKRQGKLDHKLLELGWKV